VTFIYTTYIILVF